MEVEHFFIKLKTNGITSAYRDAFSWMDLAFWKSMTALGNYAVFWRPTISAKKEHLQHFLDCLNNIPFSPSPLLAFSLSPLLPFSPSPLLPFSPSPLLPFSPSKPCWFTQDIHAINLPEDNSHGCIPSTQHCFKGEGGWSSFVVDRKFIIAM